jgi:glutaredoxin
MEQRFRYTTLTCVLESELIQPQAALANMTGRYTVPNVFVGGQAIGGGDDTKALHESGQLHTLLASAGVV